MKLTDIVAPKALKRPNLTIDLSKITNQKDAKIVLRDPTIADTFAAASAVSELLKDFPFLSPALLTSAAMLGECHVSPEAEPNQHPTFWYAGLANDNSPLFTYILGAYQKAFPDHSFGTAVEKAKNE